MAVTDITVTLPTQVSDPGQARARTLAAVNRLLEVYRATTGEFHVDVVPRHEVFPVGAFLLDDSGNLTPDASLTLDFGYGLALARTGPISAEAIQLLASGRNVPVWRTLLLNARRELVFENYRLAVVEAETAVETLADDVVASWYRSQGRSAAEVDAFLEAGFKNLVNDHLPRSCNAPFMGTAEHSAWQTGCYQVRNRVVHDGAGATEADARTAVDAAQAAVVWLSSNRKS